MIMSNAVYDAIKIIALVAAPLSVFVVAVMSALGMAETQTVTAILAALNTLLGTFVEIARRVYEGSLHDDERN